MCFLTSEKTRKARVNQETKPSAYDDLSFSEDWRSQADGFYQSPEIGDSPKTGAESEDRARGDCMSPPDTEMLDNTVGLADALSAKPRALMVSEVAAVLRISGRQIYKLVKEHRIPHLRIAGSVRFDPFALAVWLRQKAVLPDAATGSDEKRKNDGTG